MNRTDDPARRATLLWMLKGLLLVWLCYLAVRTAIQHSVPAADEHGFIVQDLLITAARGASFLLCLLFATHALGRDTVWGARRYGWGLRLSVLAIAAPLCLPYLLYPGVRAFRHDALYHGVELGIALVVAFNEETAFRVGLLEGCRGLWGDGPALLINGLAFGLMHLGYQPLADLPYLVLAGFAYALARLLGASLLLLVAAHFLNDAFFAVFSGPVPFVPVLVMKDALMGLVCVGLWAAWKRRREMVA